ncbi:MAG: NADP-dependent oxidoreductase [Cyanobacteria bacterium RYN_339]|nr:NADP-dependent oxidoreductase [Cyanobacteria bacterium RYN_339]
MPSTNQAFLLTARPVGLPRATDWQLVARDVPPLGPDEVHVAVEYISLDPAMRGWMNAGRSYVPPVGVGEVMRALGAGRVVASTSPSFAPGDAVTGVLGVQTHAVVPAAGLTKVDVARAPLQRYLGVLGMTGLTACFGLLEVGRPRPGDTVVVSAAAGAVGSVVGQIARIQGCRVVGIAGSPGKCQRLRDAYGFDATIDYKAEDVIAALRRECPKGIDVFFDNVGGTILEAALANLARHARVVICGAIAQYNATEPSPGPANYMALLVQRARMEGFVVFDYAERYAAALADLAGWLEAGQLVAHEDVVEGLDRFPDALLRLFRGENEGKLVLHVG